ncbi:endonuclease [Salipiger mangrovisoli]|uniref:Endonuclease n=1 Tax=Salipiger mangrovisoli TaxID=2865933 RepID=A0ABR9WVU7_9RHOB|nr:endonuclease [Salipiger mangrovisoli]MBE9635395.1 endonuclease [Salipiger mangrovisoli]
MTDVTMQDGCTRKCWISAALIGLVVALFALSGHKGIVAALLLGLLATGLLGALFTWMACAPVPRLGERSPTSRLTPVVEGEVPSVPEHAPSAPAPLMAAPAASEAARPAASEAPKPEPVAAKVETPAAERAKEPAVAPAAAEETGGSQPVALAQPRSGAADNLKEIKGVGPKLEQLLHELGIYHFDQIAGWNAAEVGWMDENLKGFRGRVSRDDWVGQARILAAGGETEFSKRVEDGEVY